MTNGVHHFAQGLDKSIQHQAPIDTTLEAAARCLVVNELLKR